MDLNSTQPSSSDRTAVQEALGRLWTTLDGIPDPLHRLDLLRTALNGVTGEVERTVDACRDVAVTWDLIASALGLNSKQAAQARYGG
jgi:hypothetical protein